jgi:hypothetical protein
MALNTTTELEAINTMLSVIGEAPLSSLSEISAVTDAVIARSVLNEVSREVQSMRWHFNYEKDFELLPEVGTGFIYVPPNALLADTSKTHWDKDVVQRGNRMYNKTTHSFVFDTSLKCDLVFLLEFEDLPQTAKHYITIRASRIFADRTVGSELLYKLTAQDEQVAMVSLKRAEGLTGDYNILRGSLSTYRIIDRHNPYVGR